MRKGLRGVTGCFVRVIGPLSVAETIGGPATRAYCFEMAERVRAGTLDTAAGAAAATQAGQRMRNRGVYMARHLYGAMCRTLALHAGGPDFLPMGQGCTGRHVALLREVCADVAGWNHLVRRHIAGHPWMDWRHVAYVVCMSIADLPHLRRFLHALAQGAHE